MRPALTLIACCAALLIVAPAGASAATLYAATAGGSGNGTLYRLNAQGGTPAAVGVIGYAVTGLAVDPTTGVLYGSTTANSTASPNSIIRIDKNTGAGTLVGPTGNTNHAIADIAFDSTGQLWGWSEETDELVSINKATGALTIVGSNIGSEGDGMDFDSGGTLYGMFNGASGDLFTVDTTTGDATVVTSLSGAPLPSGNMPAASFGCDGSTLFALDGLNGNPQVSLVTVNTTTGAMTTIGDVTNNTDGLAWDCTPFGTLYGATGGNGDDSITNSGVLYTLNPATGAANAIGSIGFGVTGLAIQPSTGVLYASTTTNSLNSPNSIITINKSTGAGTLVGPTGDTSGIADLAFDTLGTLWGWSEDGDELVTIDLATGAATHIGGSNSLGDGMGFEWFGNLFGMFFGDSGKIDQVNLSSGARTPGPTLTGSPYGDRSIPGASYACDGVTLYAIDGLRITPPLANLVIVDVATGAITNIGQTANQMDAVEWDCFGPFTSGGGGGSITPPVVTGVSPASGTPGSFVGISGNGFSQATQVLFGSTPTSFVIDSFDHISAVVPPGSGTVDVHVVNPAGTSATSAADTFTYTGTPPGPGVIPPLPATCPRVPDLSRRTIRGARRKMDRAGCNVPLRVGRRVPIKPNRRRRVKSQTPAPGASTSGPVTINMGYLPALRGR